VEGSLGGRWELRWEDGAALVDTPRGRLRLPPGEAGEIGGVELRNEHASERWTEIQRRPWRAFAGERGGHWRIDIGGSGGADRDGTRDLVRFPGDGGTWWRLLPPREDGPFRPEDREARVLALRDGGAVDGVGIARGGERTVRGSVVLDAGPAGAVRLSWEEGIRTVPVLDARGDVVAYRGEAATELVVQSREDEGPAEHNLWIRAPGGPPGGVVVRGAAGETAMIAGTRDHLRPWGRGTLPARATDHRLVLSLDRAILDGRLALRADGPRFAADPEEHPAVLRQITQVARTWDRGRRPLGIRVLALDARAAELQGRLPGGRWSPLRWDPVPQAWVLASPERKHRNGEDAGVPPAAIEIRIPPHREPARLSLPRPGVLVLQGDRVQPLLWALPWGEATLPPSPEPQVLRIDLGDADPETIDLRVVGGPEGTRIDDARAGPRAWTGWDGPQGDRVAAQLQGALSGDAQHRHDDALRCPARGPCFVRAVLSARREGLAALDVVLPGWAQEIRWMGEALPAGRVRDLDGRLRLSLPVGPEGRVLAIRVPSRDGSLAEGGGLRFELDADGIPRALPPEAVARSSRPPVRSPGGPAALPWQDPGRDLVVEQGGGALPDGSRLPPLGPDPLLILWPQGPGPLAQVGDVRLSWEDGPVLRSRRGDLRPVRRDAGDPQLPPTVSGPLFPEDPLLLDGEGAAGLAPGVQLTRRDDPRTARILVATPEEMVALDEDAGAIWSPAESVPALVLRADGDRVLIEASPTGTLLLPDGARRPLAAGLSWPPGARLLLPPGVRLLRPGPGAAPPPPPVWLDAGQGPVLEPRLQAAAEAALASELDRLAPGSSTAEGAVLLLDARAGMVLACASRSPAEQNLCWDDAGHHPGSTWKVLTALAVLDAPDPALRAMADGVLPTGLLRAGGGPSLRGAAILRHDGRFQPLRSRLSNHRDAPMGTQMTLEDALRNSTNTWFGYAGLLLDEPLRAGRVDAAVVGREARDRARPLLGLARRAGWSRPLPLGAGQTGRAGALPERAPDDDALVANRAIGQGEITATPLGLAIVLSAVMEDGTAPEAHLQGPGGSRTRLSSPAAAARVRRALLDVVRRGTAARAFSDHPAPHRVLGKTGSAQGVDGEGLSRTDGWFAGGVLGEGGAPDVAIVVLLPRSGLGGRHAAEVADRVSRAVLHWQDERRDGDALAGR
jgi:hypothetical protein